MSNKKGVNMAKEYIEREALINTIFPIGMPNDGNYHINAKAVRVAIEKQPPADVVEVVHGEWIDTGDEELDKIYSGYKCSVCGFIICGHSGKYCSDCGAKMDGERKEK